MAEKYCCVIDAEGRYVTYVLILDGNIQYYNLKESENLIDAKPPTYRKYAGADGFVNPLWNVETSAWVEGATDVEISAWEEQHPAPSIPDSEPTQLDRVEAQAVYTAMMTDTLLESEA